MKNQTLFDLTSMPKMILIITLIVMIGLLFGATSYLLKMPKTDSPIVNPVIETQCEIDSDCILAYTGFDTCLPCDTSIEEYKCLPSEEAKEIEEERFKRMVDDKIFCERCLEKPQHTCKCENGKCEKVKIETAEEVVITTDKTEYEQGEAIIITVQNEQNREIEICGQRDMLASFENSLPFVIEMYENYKWQYKDGYYAWPIFEGDYKDFDFMTLFKYNKYEYDLCCDVLPKSSLKLKFSTSIVGERIRIAFYLGDRNIPVYSNEFTIKEKSALDARCREKARYFDKKGIGYTILGHGFEFNLSEEKCIVVESGRENWSMESPFKTLEECREVCEKNIDTSDWQIYRNEEFGFEFEYPGKWRINSGDNFASFIQDNYFYHTLIIWNNPKNLTLDNFFGNLEKSKKIPGNEGLMYDWHELTENKYKEIIVDNKKAINFINLIGMAENTTVIIPIENKIIEFNVFGITEVKRGNIFDQILSTFKFIEK
ncbi:MAG: hypothetical protein U9N04_00240 [Patescibacteria group bacterium]|nr:hypothetical protein [Patescibacteria group bacterium]